MKPTLPILVLMISFAVGCTTMGLRSQLKHQLSQNGRYRVEIMDFDAGSRTARVRLWGQREFVDLQGAKTHYSYRHDGTNWVLRTNAGTQNVQSSNIQDRSKDGAKPSH